MSYITEHQKKFDDLQIQINNQNQLKLQANGGNSILFTYPPAEEHLYIERALEIFKEQANFIDISRLLVKFIDQDGWESFKSYYNDFKNTPHLVFHSEDPSIDLFDLIIEEIETSCRANKLPILIRSGCLYGTGIENVNIMEHRSVMNLKRPLVIFYPARLEDDSIYFLNTRSASKYRCALIK